MAYTSAFFAFQLTFAQRVADRFGLDFSDAVQRYTTIAKGIRGTAWEKYQAGLQTGDPVQWAYDWYLARRDPDSIPHDPEFYGHVLFGCFYYEVRKDEAGHAAIIRPHFIKNDEPGLRPLGRERLPVRQAEVSAMFQHIQEHVPTAQTVMGNSWLYNLAAYRRIYPSAFTATRSKLSQRIWEGTKLVYAHSGYSFLPKFAVTGRLNSYQHDRKGSR